MEAEQPETKEQIRCLAVTISSRKPGTDASIYKWLGAGSQPDSQASSVGDTVLDIAELLIGSPSIQLFHDQALYKPARASDGTYGGNMQWQCAPLPRTPSSLFVWALILCPRSPLSGPSAFAQR